MGQRAILLCKIGDAGFKVTTAKDVGSPYQFPTLEFTVPGTWVFFGPRSDSGLHIRQEWWGGRETENERVISVSMDIPSQLSQPLCPAKMPVPPPLRADMG